MENLESAGYAVEGRGIPYPVLYDSDAEVSKQYEVYNLLNDGMAAPSTFVIDKEGVIRWQFIGTSKSHRPSFSAITDALGELQQ